MCGKGRRRRGVGRQRQAEVHNQIQEPHTKMWRKTQCFATFLPFRAPGSLIFGDFLFLIFLIFFLLSSSLLFSPLLSSPLLFSSLLFPSSSLLFTSLLFSYSSHLCFSSVHIVGRLTTKLPSTIN